jgi:DNA-binding response OmpR family regulator
MKKNIMLVDDDTHIHKLMSIILERGGFSVVSVTSSQAALALLENSTPDLFILDMMMPELDGAELCRRIRQRPQTVDTPVIILSARSDAHSVKRALEAGVDAYLPKPILHHELVGRIRDLLNLNGEAIIG